LCYEPFVVGCAHEGEEQDAQQIARWTWWGVLCLSRGLRAGGAGA